MAIPYDPTGGAGSPYSGGGGLPPLPGSGGSSSGGGTTYTWMYITKDDGSKWQVPRMNQPPFTYDWNNAVMLNPPKATSGGSSGGSSGGGGSSYSGGGGGGGSVAAPYDTNKDWNLVKAGDGQYYWVNMYTQEVVPASGLPGEMPVDEPTVPKTFTNDGTVVGINPITGEVVWDYEFPEDPAAKEYKYTTIDGAIYYYDPANPSAGYNKLNPAAGGLYGGTGKIGGPSKPQYITPYSNSMVGNSKVWDAADFGKSSGGGGGYSLANSAAKNALELEFLKQKNKANLSYQSALADMRSNAPMTAAEKANYQLQLEQLGLSKWEAQQRVAQEEKRRRLEAIGQLQSAISTTDPAAFAAMMAAYGGNIENALAGGGTALSPAAMLPAAALFAELGNAAPGGGGGAGAGGGGADPTRGVYMGGTGDAPVFSSSTDPGGGATTGGSAASTERVEKLLGKIQEIIAQQMARPGKAGYGYEQLTKSRIQSEIDRRSKYNPALKLAYEYYKGIDSENPTISLDTLTAYLDAMSAAEPSDLYKSQLYQWKVGAYADQATAGNAAWEQAYQQALAQGLTQAPDAGAYRQEYYKAVDDYNKQVESYYQPINSTLDYESQKALGDIPVYSINGQMWTDYGKYQGIWNPQQTAIAPSGQYAGGQYGDTSQTWSFDNPFAHPSVLPQNQGQPTPASDLPAGNWALNTVVDAPYTATGSEFTYDGGTYAPISAGTTLDVGTPYWVQGMATGGKAPTDEPYMVGEIGPELIIPGADGDEVIPLYDIPGYATGTNIMDQMKAQLRPGMQYPQGQPPATPNLPTVPYQLPDRVSEFAPYLPGQMPTRGLDWSQWPTRPSVPMVPYQTPLANRWPSNFPAMPTSMPNWSQWQAPNVVTAPTNPQSIMNRFPTNPRQRPTLPATSSYSAPASMPSSSQWQQKYSNLTMPSSSQWQQKYGNPSMPSSASSLFNNKINVPGVGEYDLSKIKGFAFGTDERSSLSQPAPTTSSVGSARSAGSVATPTPTTSPRDTYQQPTSTSTSREGYQPTNTPVNTTPTSYNQSPVPTDVATSWANMGIFGNNIDIPEWLQPFLGQVQDIREGVQYPSLNPYAVDFGLTDPTIMQMWALGRQAQYGIPVASTMFEAQRQALPGIGSTYSVRY